MQVEVSSDVPEDWDAYVNGHPASTAYHRAAAVEVGRAAFGLKTFYLSARAGNRRLVGVLPLVEQSSLLFGRFLVSVPFFTYGGVLSDDSEAAAALAKTSASLARERKADHVELRHSQGQADLQLPTRLDKVSMVLPLPPDKEALAKQLGAKLRSQVRRAHREHLEFEWGGADLLDDFYPVYAAGMHSLGTPVYPRRFFHVVGRAFGPSLSTLIVRMAGQIHAVAVLIRHGASVEVPWAITSAAAKRVSVNMAMYMQLLERCIDMGAGRFDFGRSTVDSGTYRFKAQWGAMPEQLHWHYCLPPGVALPMMNTSNPKFALAADLWRRMPLWAANRLGPHLAKLLP